MSAPVFNQLPTVKNRPFAHQDSNHLSIPSTWNDMAFQGDYSGTNLIYGGRARPGSATSAAVWKIFKMTYDGSNNMLTIKWPQDSYSVANNDYQFIWDNRASYTYS